MVPLCVDDSLVAQVVASWTGIPLSRWYAMVDASYLRKRNHGTAPHWPKGCPEYHRQAHRRIAPIWMNWQAVEVFLLTGPTKRG